MTEARTLANYEILDQLGQGGMGTVYRARDRVLERTVAVKVLHPSHAPSASEGGNRFLNEARAIARLSHPAIVAVYEFSDADPASVFIAMEYVDGVAIEEYVRGIQGDDIGPTLELVDQLLSGLGYAHERGVVHRDIKPSNLLVTPEGRLKITDFGIATVDSLRHTQTGLMIGTPAYMAPERYTGAGIDQRCDVYSAGVLCYELLTGRRPFAGELTEMIYKICHAAPAAMTAVRPGLPDLLDRVIAKALAKEPAARYQTAREFAVALLGVQEQLGCGRGRGNPAAAGGPQGAASAVSAVAATMPVTRPRLVTEADMADIVRQLTPILGPLAGITVRRAAARTRDRAGLYRLLADELRTDGERERFLAMAPREGRADVGQEAAATPTSLDPIAPATLERATRILARYIGPIASVVVKKTAAGAVDESDLYTRLAERIANEHERARCVADLTRPL